MGLDFFFFSRVLWCDKIKRRKEIGRNKQSNSCSRDVQQTIIATINKANTQLSSCILPPVIRTSRRLQICGTVWFFLHLRLCDKLWFEEGWWDAGLLWKEGLRGQTSVDLYERCGAFRQTAHDQQIGVFAYLLMGMICSLYESQWKTLSIMEGAFSCHRSWR